MMQFRTAKAAMQKTLGDNAHGRFRTIGYTAQSKHADEIKDNKRLVQVIYDQGQFPQNASSYYESASHDIQLNIALSVSAASKADITKLNDPDATDEERAAALTAMIPASEVADELLDDFIDIIFNIIMDARNDALGLAQGVIANRWINSIKKHDTYPDGNLVIKTAIIEYSCRVNETFVGDTGNYPDEVKIETDDGSGTGVTVTNDNTEE